MVQNKSSFMDKLTSLVEKIAGPLSAFAQLDFMQAIQQGLVQTMPVIIIGSVFLILFVLGSPSVDNSGTALLPFLAPLAGKFVIVNSFTLGFLGLYASMTIAMNYGELKGVEVKNCALLGLVAFLLLNLNGTMDDGGISIANFGAAGLFVAILTALFSVRIYKFFVDKNITIKMPSSVPPAIGLAFTSLIPFAAVFTICWLIRTVMEFDMVAWMNTILAPLFSTADNIGTYTAWQFTQNLLWSVGLHGDNMVSGIFQPFTLEWTAENAAALAAGTPINELPHLMTYSGIDRLTNWPAAVWPLIILMITSRVKYLKALGWACLPAAVFTIVEPVIFGLPLALNPYLIIPFLLITLVTSIVTYGIFSTGLIGRFYASLPWATPPFILGPLGTNDWKTLLVLILVIVIGLLIYYPFWRQFENAELAREAENEKENELISEIIQEEQASKL